MMYTSMVGVEMLDDVANTNKRVDLLSLEMLESVAKAHVNINKVDQQVGEIDHQVELLEELRCHYQEFLRTNKHWLIRLNQEIQTLKVRCDGLVQTNGALNHELGQYHDLVLLQTQTINAQNTFIQGLEAKVQELKEIVMPELGRTLGNPILIEDDVVVKEEDDLRSPRPPVVTTLIKIKD